MATKDKNLHYAKGAAVNDAQEYFNQFGTLKGWRDEYSDIGTGEKWLMDAQGMGYAGSDNVYQPEEIQRLLTDSGAVWNAAPKEAKFGRLTDKLQEYLPYIALAAQAIPGVGQALSGALGPKLAGVLTGTAKFSNNPLTNFAANTMLNKAVPGYDKVRKYGQAGQMLGGMFGQNKLATGLAKAQQSPLAKIKTQGMGSSILSDAKAAVGSGGAMPQIDKAANPFMAFAQLGVNKGLESGNIDPFGAAGFTEAAGGVDAWKGSQGLPVNPYMAMVAGLQNKAVEAGQLQPEVRDFNQEQMASPDAWNIQDMGMGQTFSDGGKKPSGGGFGANSGGLADTAKMALLGQLMDKFMGGNDKPAPVPAAPAGGAGGGGGLPTYSSLVGFATNRDAQDDQYNRWKQRNGRV